MHARHVLHVFLRLRWCGVAHAALLLRRRRFLSRATIAACENKKTIKTDTDKDEAFAKPCLTLKI
jgi:hypothetical protein